MLSDSSPSSRVVCTAKEFQQATTGRNDSDAAVPWNAKYTIGCHGGEKEVIKARTGLFFFAVSLSLGTIRSNWSMIRGASTS